VPCTSSLSGRRLAASVSRHAALQLIACFVLP